MKTRTSNGPRILYMVVVASMTIVLSQCSEVVRVLAVTGPGSSHVRAIVPGKARAFIPMTKTASRLDRVPVTNTAVKDEVKANSNWKRNSQEGKKSGQNTRRIGYGHAFRGGDEFSIHSAGGQGDNVVVSGRGSSGLESQGVVRNDPYGGAGQHYTIRHVYIVKMMPASMNSEEIIREVGDVSSIRSKTMNGRRESAVRDTTNSGSHNHRNVDSGHTSTGSVPYYDGEGSRTGNSRGTRVRNSQSDNSERDTRPSSSVDLADLTIRDHLASAASQHRSTQIIVLPPPLYPDGAMIRGRTNFEGRVNLNDHMDGQGTMATPASSNKHSSYKTSNSATVGNALDNLMSSAQAWKAHPEVLVIRTAPTRRPPPFHSFGSTFAGSPLSLDYY